MCGGPALQVSTVLPNEDKGQSLLCVCVHMHTTCCLPNRAIVLSLTIGLLHSLRPLNQ